MGTCCRLLAGSAVFAVAACATHRVDVNRAPAAEIARLPGLTAEDAARVAASRPYYVEDELVARGVLDRRVYEEVRDHIYLGPPAMPEYLRWVAPPAEGP